MVVQSGWKFDTLSLLPSKSEEPSGSNSPEIPVKPTVSWTFQRRIPSSITHTSHLSPSLSGLRRRTDTGNDRHTKPHSVNWRDSVLKE